MAPTILDEVKELNRRQVRSQSLSHPVLLKPGCKQVAFLNLPLPAAGEGWLIWFAKDKSRSEQRGTNPCLTGERDFDCERLCGYVF